MTDQLIFKTDRFNSILMDLSAQKMDLQKCVESLQKILPEWKYKGHKGIWLSVNKDQCSCLSSFIELGFDFHHAQPGYVLLNMFLPDDLPNNLPPYANQYLGVAGFVVNSNNEVLVIRESYHYHAQKNLSMWKLPGGHADQGEEISETAKREVLEETGINSEFVCVLAFRHMHNYRFGCSDFYHVCLMRPLSTEIKACPVEIADCKWMDLEEYGSLENLSDANRSYVKCYKDVVATGIGIGVEDVLSFDKKSFNKIYSAGKISLTPEASACSQERKS